MNREDLYPGISAYFSLRALSVCRTKKNFSRTAQDITLEQICNWDAASRHTGICAFTNTTTGRKGWCVPRAARSMVVSILCDMAGTLQKEKVAQVY